MIHGEHDPGTGSVSVLPADEDMSEKEHEVIAVGAVLAIFPGDLATSVFERMCATDPLFGTRLRPCRRRLVSADSSPLMVRGELDMTIVFPGLRCDMVLVVASIGLEGLLGMEALQSCLPHQLDLRTGQLWADGQLTLQLHQQRQAVWASAHVNGSMVILPDSEIVAPMSIWSCQEFHRVGVP